jgi:hypothetical protein
MQYVLPSCTTACPTHWSSWALTGWCCPWLLYHLQGRSIRNPSFHFQPINLFILTSFHMNHIYILGAQTWWVWDDLRTFFSEFSPVPPSLAIPLTVFQGERCNVAFNGSGFEISTDSLKLWGTPSGCWEFSQFFWGHSLQNETYTHMNRMNDWSIPLRSLYLGCFDSMVWVFFACL